MRVLLVEDDVTLGQGIRDGLQLSGHAVDWLDDGRDAREGLQYDDFDAVILDLGLPGAGGLEVLSAWRRRDDRTPVLVLTANDENETCVKLLKAGADDLVVKPTPLDQIEARLVALARRSGGHADNTLRWGPLSLDRGGNLIEIHGEPLRISAYERSVLEALLEHPGHVVSRESLEDRLYGWEDGPESNSLEVLIHKLRSKVGRELIETVRGLGYRLGQ